MADLGQLLNPQPMPYIPDVPVGSGAQNFFEALQQDPALSQAMGQIGAQLMRPYLRSTGAAGNMANAIDEGMKFLQARRDTERAQGLAERKQRTDEANVQSQIGLRTEQTRSAKTAANVAEATSSDEIRKSAIELQKAEIALRKATTQEEIDNILMDISKRKAAFTQSLLANPESVVVEQSWLADLRSPAVESALKEAQTENQAAQAEAHRADAKAKSSKEVEEKNRPKVHVGKDGDYLIEDPKQNAIFRVDFPDRALVEAKAKKEKWTPEQLNAALKPRYTKIMTVDEMLRQGQTATAPTVKPAGSGGATDVTDLVNRLRKPAAVSNAGQVAVTPATPNPAARISEIQTQLAADNNNSMTMDRPVYQWLQQRLAPAERARLEAELKTLLSQTPPQ